MSGGKVSASVLAPVIAVAVTVGLAYSMGMLPFGPGASAGPVATPSDDDTFYFSTLCDADQPQDCEPTDDDLREAREGRRDDTPPTAPAVTAAPEAGRDYRKPLPPAVNGVRTLYDDRWVVEEGQWSLGEFYDQPPGTPGPTFRTMLESVGPQAAFISTPGFYGYYRVVVELHEHAPAVPSWCQDAAEVSLRISGEQAAFSMSSFETFSDPVTVPAGTYRVRYCTEKQDRAVTQEEFTGDDYTVYAGRHLLQLWKAPRTADRVLRAGSRWARDLGRSG